MRFIWLPALCLFGVIACSRQDEPPPAPEPIQFARASADLVKHGERVARVLGCNGCHGEDLTGEDWSEPGFAKLWTANLSRAVPRLSDAQLARIITSGALPDRPLWGMPSHLFTQLNADDMAALIAYLRTVPPKGEVHPAPVLEKLALEEIAAGTFSSSPDQVKKEGNAWPPDVGKGHELARYIVRATCAECHNMDLRGGTPYPGAKPRPDLRIAGAYDPAQFKRLLRTGIAPGEREVSLMSEVARGRYKHMTDAEIEAVRLYLKAVAEKSP